MKNYYKILGLPMTASDSEIEHAFRSLAKKYSGAAVTDRSAASRFAEINEAYSVLSNVVLRSRYDKSVLTTTEIKVNLTDIDDSLTTEMPHTAWSEPIRSTTITQSFSQPIKDETILSQPVSEPVTVTQPVSRSAADVETRPIADPVPEPLETRPVEEKIAATQTGEKKRSTKDKKALAESIAERAAAVREAYEKAAEQMAAKREAERKAREARAAAEAQKSPEQIAAEKAAAEKAAEEKAKARREALEKELAARRERDKRERAEREALERARKEAARLKEQHKEERSDVTARMQSLMNRLGEKQTERSEAAKASFTQPTIELSQPAPVSHQAVPEPVAHKSVAEPVKTVHAVPVEPTRTFDAVVARITAEVDRQTAALKETVEQLRKSEKENAAAVAALTEEIRNMKNSVGSVSGAVSQKLDQTTAEMLKKLNEAEASAEAAAAASALHAAKARELQNEIDAADKRLEAAVHNLEDLKREKMHLQSEMEIESAARRRAENAVEGAKQAARSYKAESERAARRAAEEKSARVSAERAFTSEAKARKRAEELSRADREAAMRMSREIAALKVAKERAELKSEEIRMQITRAAAEAERERLEKLQAKQAQVVKELGNKLADAETEKQALETKVQSLEARMAEQRELDREIAGQLSDFEQFKERLSDADEQRLIADWESKVRADVMLFKDTYYGTLGVPYYASVTEMAASAEKLLSRYAMREDTDRDAKIAAVEQARDTLLDPQKRILYNREIGLDPSEITAALKAKACYDEIVRKAGRESASRAFFEQFDSLAYDAQTGNAEAQNRLGEAYYDGVDIPADPQQAVFWFKEAAKQLYPAALFNMGICLLNGYGVERDEMRGRGFVKKAAMSGYRPAVELSDSPEFKRPIKAEYD